MAENTEGKRPQGRPKNIPTVPPEVIPEVSAECTSRYQLSEKTGISHDDAKVIRRVTGLSVEECQARTVAKFQDLLDDALDALKPKIQEMSGPQLAIASGIFADKISANPKSVANNLHIHIKSGDRDGLLKAILGKHADRVSSQDANLTKPLKMAEPVTDITPDTTPKQQQGS